MGGGRQIGLDLSSDSLVERLDQVLGEAESVVSIALVRVESDANDGRDDQDDTDERNAEAADPSPQLSPCLPRIGIDVDDFVAAHLADLGERQALAGCFRMRREFRVNLEHRGWQERGGSWR